MIKHNASMFINHALSFIVGSIASLTLSLSLLLAPAVYAGEVYKSVDENGVPSFSDSKTKNAEKIIVEPVNVQKIPTPKVHQPSARSDNSTADASQYKQLKMSSPADKATIRNEPKTTLSAIIEPSLRAGHLVEFLDNGQVLQPASQNTSIVLKAFQRGEHSLSVRVVDRKGNAVQSSNAITVFVFRAAVNSKSPVKTLPVNKPAATKSIAP